ncbi:Rhamnan synthesis protein F [compost metagenome]
MKRVGVFAHYDKDGKLSKNTLTILQQLERVCDRIIMVSTKLNYDEIKLLPAKVECHIRDNIGYDFYSYKYGIEQIDNIYIYDQLLLMNDSFFVSSKFDIEKIMGHVDNSNYEICGLIDSYQFNYHVQTFFVVIKKEAFFSVWFKQFWDSVTVLDTKIEIIFNYEIGLSQSAISHSLMVGSCFSWKAGSYIRAYFNSIQTKRLNLLLLSLFNYKYLREGNTSHILWKEIYEDFGICKWEVIRMYPEVRRYIERVGNEFEISEIQNYLNTKASFYKEKKIDDTLIVDDNKTVDRYSLENIKNNNYKKCSLAVVVHLFYLELLDEIESYLRNIPIKFDLYISVVSLSSAMQVEKKLKHFTNANVYIYCVKNQGRDVAPFIYLVNTEVLDDYNCVCKIHSKKSLYSNHGTNWRQDIYNEILGSTNRVLSIINTFRDNSDVGIIGPEKSYLTNDEFWGANRERVYGLSRKIGLDNDQVSLGFFAGTMFWFNPKILKTIKDLNLTLNDFEEEDGLQDGSFAHTIERFVTLVARKDNYKITTVEFLDSDVLNRDYSHRKVMVLP